MRHTWYHVATEGAGDEFLKRFKEIEEYWKCFITAYEGRQLCIVTSCVIHAYRYSDFVHT